jgi:hypothetical protein
MGGEPARAASSIKEKIRNGEAIILYVFYIQDSIN